MAKILIIDNAAGMRQIMIKTLSPQGHVIIPAEDGAQGLELFRRESPDAVIMDIQLPDMEGSELLPQLKRIKPAVPVILLAGFADLDVAETLVEQGGYGYLAKPFRVNDLIQMVGRAVPGGRAPAAAPAAPLEPEAAEQAAAVPAEGPAAKPRKRRVLPMVIALLLLGGGAALVLQYAGTGGREAWLSVPYANPSGLCWDGKSVWACDWVTGTVYRHTRDDSLTLLSSYKVPGVEPTGIACDGKNIWLSHAFGQKIYKERPDGKLVVLATYPSPGPTPGGLYYDGNALWSLDYQKGRVYRHVMNRALSVATAYDSPAANPCGMFRYGKDYFIADGATGRLFAVRPDNFAIRGVFELPGPDAKKMHLTAATCDGKNLWAGFDETSKLLRLPMKKLVKVKQ